MSNHRCPWNLTIELVLFSQASAGDMLFFSSMALHASHRNVVGSADRWALISTYRNAAEPDLSKVFPHALPVLRRGAKIGC